MKRFFSQKKISDERIEGLQSRIFRELYYLTLFVVIASIMVKIYAYGYDLKSIATELLIIIISGIYYVIRTIWLGIYSDELEIEERAGKIPVPVKYALVSSIIGIVIALYFGVRSAFLYGEDGIRLYYFFLTFFASIIIYVPFFLLILMMPYLTAKRLSKKRDDNNED